MFAQRRYHRPMAMIRAIEKANSPVGSPTELAAKLFRGFADPTRLAIVVELQNGERRVSDFVTKFAMSQANVSGHVACLKECGLLDDRHEGRQVFYRLAHPEIIELLVAAEQLLERTGTSVSLCPNYATPQPTPNPTPTGPRGTRSATPSTSPNSPMPKSPDLTSPRTEQRQADAMSPTARRTSRAR